MSTVDTAQRFVTDNSQGEVVLNSHSRIALRQSLVKLGLQPQLEPPTVSHDTAMLQAQHAYLLEARDLGIQFWETCHGSHRMLAPRMFVLPLAQR